MSQMSKRGTLPIRRWLALALVSIFLIPFCMVAAFAVATIGHDPNQARNKAVDLLEDNVGRWDDPAWRAGAAQQLASDDIAFVLNEGGQEVYRSMPDPVAGADGGEGDREVELVTIEGSRPARSAAVYYDGLRGPPGSAPDFLFPIIFLSGLALALIATGWLIGRGVLQPLSATGEAARQVAEGNLDVKLPSSRVREVAELNAAFETMSAELKRSLEQRTELEQERRLLIGAVAHDLRTPLFTLRGYLDGLQQGLADTPEKRERYLSIAQEKASDLERLISDLFAYTRLEYLDQPPEREPLDLAALLERQVESMASLADAKDVELIFEGPAAPVMVEGDRHLLVRAIENLIDNALRHTPSGGEVRVACSSESGRALFSVEDTGPGIPDEDLEQIFAPLYRGDTSRNRRTGGAGLGLTIARRTLEAHGGTLTAANSEQRGAIFSGILPTSDPV